MQTKYVLVFSELFANAPAWISGKTISTAPGSHWMVFAITAVTALRRFVGSIFFVGRCGRIPR